MKNYKMTSVKNEARAELHDALGLTGAELEDDGLIDREVFAEVPPRVEYSLSDLGKSLRPIWDAMETWGVQYKNSL